MSDSTKEGPAVKQLCQTWEALLDGGGLSEELEYRIRKMLDRMTPITKKIYLKTAKGQAMLLQCLEKTAALQEDLRSSQENVFSILTDLEKLFDDLLKTTYKFRVRTG